MRKFTVTLSFPGNCDCCGQPLPAHEADVARSAYRLELPEGHEPATCLIGNAARISLKRGELVVALRRLSGADRAWELGRHYNPDAFHLRNAKLPHEAWERDGEWQIFCFDLPEFNPTFSTWWAELKFEEVQPFKRDAHGHCLPAHNPGKLSVKLETLT